MKTDLEMLAELRDLLGKDPNETLAVSLWDRVLSLEASLEVDPRTTKNEKALIAALRKAVSDFILAYREGRNAHPSRAHVAVTALESSIMKRTTGSDGWPLKS